MSTQIATVWLSQHDLDMELRRALKIATEHVITSKVSGAGEAIQTQGVVECFPDGHISGYCIFAYSNA